MNNDAKAKTKEQRHAHRINVYVRCYLGEMQSNSSKCAPFDKNRNGCDSEFFKFRGCKLPPLEVIN